MNMFLRIATFALVWGLVGCQAGDAPLLSTELPNGYTFESNGGRNGYIRSPEGVWLSESFGIQSDGSERWCTEFGWEDAVVVCRLFDEAKLPVVTDLGYLVLNTETGAVSVARSGEEATSLLKGMSVDSLPDLATSFVSTRIK